MCRMPNCLPYCSYSLNSSGWTKVLTRSFCRFGWRYCPMVMPSAAPSLLFRSVAPTDCRTWLIVAVGPSRHSPDSAAPTPSGRRRGTPAWVPMPCRGRWCRAGRGSRSRGRMRRGRGHDEGRSRRDSCSWRR